MSVTFAGPWTIAAVPAVQGDGATLTVRRSLEGTKDGLRFKEPKTGQSKRTNSLPSGAVTALRERRRKVLETRMALGLGKPDPDALFFGEPAGSPTAN